MEERERIYDLGLELINSMNAIFRVLDKSNTGFVTEKNFASILALSGFPFGSPRYQSDYGAVVSRYLLTSQSPSVTKRYLLDDCRDGEAYILYEKFIIDAHLLRLEGRGE